MRFLLGWAVKLGFLAVVVLFATGYLRLQLPEKVFGYEVPVQARQWVDRNAQFGEIGAKIQSSFKQIADSFK